MAICPICNQSIGLMSKVKIKDSVVCTDCGWWAGISTEYVSLEQMKEFVQIMRERDILFTTTCELSSFLSPEKAVIDDTHRLFYVGKRKEKLDRLSLIYSFDEVIGYEYQVLGGKTVTKSKGGLGRAVVGGALFGGVGAVVGATTAKKESKVEGQMHVLHVEFQTCIGKSSRNFPHVPDGFTNFLDKCLDEQSVQSNPIELMSADEILKYKQLLDVGAITQEEFDAKKKQLLGL